MAGCEGCIATARVFSTTARCTSPFNFSREGLSSPGQLPHLPGKAVFLCIGCLSFRLEGCVLFEQFTVLIS